MEVVLDSLENLAVHNREVVGLLLEVDSLLVEGLGILVVVLVDSLLLVVVDTRNQVDILGSLLVDNHQRMVEGRQYLVGLPVGNQMEGMKEEGIPEVDNLLQQVDSAVVDSRWMGIELEDILLVLVLLVVHKLTKEKQLQFCFFVFIY